MLMRCIRDHLVGRGGVAGRPETLQNPRLVFEDPRLAVAAQLGLGFIDHMSNLRHRFAFVLVGESGPFGHGRECQGFPNLVLLLDVFQDGGCHDMRDAIARPVETEGIQLAEANVHDLFPLVLDYRPTGFDQGDVGRAAADVYHKESDQGSAIAVAQQAADQAGRFEVDAAVRQEMKKHFPQNVGRHGDRFAANQFDS